MAKVAALPPPTSSPPFSGSPDAATVLFSSLHGAILSRFLYPDDVIHQIPGDTVNTSIPPQKEYKPPIPMESCMAGETRGVIEARIRRHKLASAEIEAAAGL